MSLVLPSIRTRALAAPDSRSRRGFHAALGTLGHPADRADVAVDYGAAVLSGEAGEFSLTELAARAGGAGSRDRFRHLLQRSSWSATSIRRALLRSALAEGIAALLVEIEPMVHIDAEEPEDTTGQDLISLSALGNGPPIPLGWVCVEHPPAPDLDISDADREGVLEVLQGFAEDWSALDPERELPTLLAHDFYFGEDDLLRAELRARLFEYVFPLTADYTAAAFLIHPYEEVTPARTLAEQLDHDDPQRVIRELAGPGGHPEFIIAGPAHSFAVVGPQIGLGPDAISGHRPRNRAREISPMRPPVGSLARELRVSDLRGVAPEALCRHAYLISALTLIAEKRFVAVKEATQ